MPTVNIDSRYWRTVLKDYRNYKFAWVREAGQNSLDAGSTHIDVSIYDDADGNARIVWVDNGKGLSRGDYPKLMSLGGSGKDGDDSHEAAGGFGVAKSILFFAQGDYEILSDDWIIVGQGSSYEIDSHPYTKGMTIKVTMRDANADEMIKALKDWAAWTTTRARISVNGRFLDTLRNVKARTENDWCRISTIRSRDDHVHPYKIRVRINDQFMFDKWTSVNAHIMVDLKGTDSQKLLTANRDGLQWHISHRLDRLVEQIYSDPKKVTESNYKRITVYEGTDGYMEFVQKTNNKAGKLPKKAAFTPKPAADAPRRAAAMATSADSIPQDNNWVFTKAPKLRDGYDIVVSNSLNRDVPDKFLPDSMSASNTKLMERWIAIVQAVGNILNCRIPLRVGWNFNNNSARASYLKDPDHGQMILLNPVTVRNNRLVSYFKNDTKSFYELVSIAVHEFTHIDNPGHTEAFARDMTYGMAKVMARVTALEQVRKATK